MEDLGERKRLGHINKDNDNLDNHASAWLENELKNVDVDSGSNRIIGSPLEKPITQLNNVFIIFK